MEIKCLAVVFLIALIQCNCVSAQKIEPDVPKVTNVPVSDPSTSTVQPETTTFAPEPTTQKTTEPPTTVAPVTTTIAPTPLEPATWSYPPNSNKTCLIVRFALKLNVTYKLENETSVPYEYILPAKSVRVLSGDCNNETDSIKLAWGSAGSESTIAMEFIANKSSFGLSKLLFTLNATDLFPSAEANQTIVLTHQAPVNSSDFLTPMEMSYHCTKEQSLNLTSAEDGAFAGKVTVSKVQWEAFHTKEGDKFSTARDCDAADTPDIVPIAVGCALAGLVIVVLIAYLVGRRRAQARGYVSM